MWYYDACICIDTNLIKYKENVVLNYVKRIYKDIQRTPLFHDITLKNINSSYFRYDDNKTKYICSLNHHKGIDKLKTHSPTYCVMDGLENMLDLTHSAKYIWQEFYESTVFRKVCTMAIMRWCSVQTNEYDLQAKNVSDFVHSSWIAQ